MKLLNKNSEHFKSLLRPLLENKSSFVHLLSMVSEMKDLCFSAFSNFTV